MKAILIQLGLVVLMAGWLAICVYLAETNQTAAIGAGVVGVALLALLMLVTIRL